MTVTAYPSTPHTPQALNGLLTLLQSAPDTLMGRGSVKETTKMVGNVNETTLRHRLVLV